MLSIFLVSTNIIQGFFSVPSFFAAPSIQYTIFNIDLFGHLQFYVDLS